MMVLAKKLLLQLSAATTTMKFNTGYVRTCVYLFVEALDQCFEILMAVVVVN